MTAAHGDRIRELLAEAQLGVSIIAPFIKVGALESLLDAVDPSVHVRCVSRWLPRDVAAKVTDVEILDVLRARGNYTLTVCDSLHAKLYVGDDRCLAGSANVTLRGLGEAKKSNIELLLPSEVSAPNIVEMLQEVSDDERPATDALAAHVKRLAESVTTMVVLMKDGEIVWFPRSRFPERAYDLYSAGPDRFRTTADSLVLGDVADANIPPGLSRRAFIEHMSRRIEEIPVVAQLLADSTKRLVREADAATDLDEMVLLSDDIGRGELWQALVSWVTYFCGDQIVEHETTEISLRKAGAVGW